MKTFFFSTVLFLFPYWANAQTNFIEIQSVEDWESMLEISTEKQKFIFLFIGSDDCSPCANMVDSVLNTDQIQAEIQSNFIPVYVNSQSFIGQRFIYSFDINELPNSLWITGSEFVWLSIGGTTSVSEFEAKLEHFKSLVSSYPTLMFEALNKPDKLTVEQWYDLLYISSINQLPIEESIIHQFQRSIPIDSMQSPVYYPFISTYMTDFQGSFFKHISVHPETVLGEGFDWESYYNSLYSFHLSNAIETKDSAFVEVMQNQLLPFAHNEVDSTLRVVELWQEYFCRVGSIGRYLDYSDTALLKVQLNEEIIKSQVDFALNYTTSDDVVISMLRWINHALTFEKTVDLYIMKADMLVRLNKLSEATEALSKAEKGNPNTQQKESIEFLDFIIRNRY